MYLYTYVSSYIDMMWNAKDIKPISKALHIYQKLFLHSDLHTIIYSYKSCKYNKPRLSMVILPLTYYLGENVDRYICICMYELVIT